MDAECDKLGRRPSNYVNGMFITLSVKLCLPHDAREAAHRAGPSTTADTSSLSSVNEYSIQGQFTDVGLTEARSLKTVSAKAIVNNLSPRGRRDDMPHRWQFDSRRIYVRPRSGPQSAHG